MPACTLARVYALTPAHHPRIRVHVIRRDQHACSKNVVHSNRVRVNPSQSPVIPDEIVWSPGPLRNRPHRLSLASHLDTSFVTVGSINFDRRRQGQNFCLYEFPTSVAQLQHQSYLVMGNSHSAQTSEASEHSAEVVENPDLDQPVTGEQGMAASATGSRSVCRGSEI